MLVPRVVDDWPVGWAGKYSFQLCKTSVAHPSIHPSKGRAHKTPTPTTLSNTLCGLVSESPRAIGQLTRTGSESPLLNATKPLWQTGCKSTIDTCCRTTCFAATGVVTRGGSLEGGTGGGGGDGNARSMAAGGLAGGTCGDSRVAPLYMCKRPSREDQVRAVRTSELQRQGMSKYAEKIKN